MYKVTMVFNDSSTISDLVIAKDEKSALNAIINHTKTVKQPKFVIFEKPYIVASEDDLNLVSEFQSAGFGDNNVYTFNNKLSEVIDVGGISICLGHLDEYKKFVGEVS